MCCDCEPRAKNIYIKLFIIKCVILRGENIYTRKLTGLLSYILSTLGLIYLIKKLSSSFFVNLYKYVGLGPMPMLLKPSKVTCLYSTINIVINYYYYYIYTYYLENK